RLPPTAPAAAALVIRRARRWDEGADLLLEPAARKSSHVVNAIERSTPQRRGGWPRTNIAIDLDGNGSRIGIENGSYGIAGVAPPQRDAGGPGSRRAPLPGAGDTVLSW